MLLLRAVSRPLVLLVVLALAQTAQADDPRIYMMAKVRIDQTTFGLIAFFYNKDVKDMKTCEREVIHGLQGRWQYYYHTVGRGRGFATSPSYLCLETPLKLTPWNQHATYKYIYLVDLRGGTFKLNLNETYSACMTALRKVQPDEDAKLFCARANQQVLKP